MQAVSLEQRAPFRRPPDSLASAPAKVTGKLPDWLKGSLLRTAPAIFERNGWRAEHWFDGLGMLYAFRIESGGAVSFRKAILDSEHARDAEAGRARQTSFGSPLFRSFFRRLFEPVAPATDNANVNVVRLGDQLVAMTESERQLVIDPESFAVKGEVAYEDNLPSAFMTAHPHMDFERGTAVNLSTSIGASNAIMLYDHAPSSRTRRLVARWATRRIPMVHSFGLTPAHAILIAHPYTANPLGFLWSNQGYVDHFRWSPEDGTRLVVLDRETGATREHLTDAFFCFHTVNAFEDGAATVLDLLAYDSPEVIEQTRVGRMRDTLPDLRAKLVRIRMEPGVERASIETLSDVGFEFPSIAYKRTNGKPYRFCYGACDGPEGARYASSIVKIDVETGKSRSFVEGDSVFGEPIFVARPGGTGEDDGVLVAVGSSSSTDRSALVVLDAQSLEPVAHAEVPFSIPLGFHGSFLR
ncbi:MAG: carotenoid oxygenase family protein [Polyangiales bacterium]